MFRWLEEDKALPRRSQRAALGSLAHDPVPVFSFEPVAIGAAGVSLVGQHALYFLAFSHGAEFSTLSEQNQSEPTFPKWRAA